MKKSYWITIAAAALLAAVVFAPAGERAESHRITPEPAPISTPVAAKPSTAGPLALSSTPLPESRKDQLASNNAREEHSATMAAKHDHIDFDEPRRGPAEALQVAESRTEREMSATEKAHQTQRIVDALEDRAGRVKRRLDDARSRGDEHEARRQALIHRRLSARVDTLAERVELLQ